MATRKSAKKDAPSMRSSRGRDSSQDEGLAATGATEHVEEQARYEESI
jgi:hypothetical protein